MSFNASVLVCSLAKNQEEVLNNVTNKGKCMQCANKFDIITVNETTVITN